MGGASRPSSLIVHVHVDLPHLSSEAVLCGAYESHPIRNSPSFGEFFPSMTTIGRGLVAPEGACESGECLAALEPVGLYGSSTPDLACSVTGLTYTT